MMCISGPWGNWLMFLLVWTSWQSGDALSDWKKGNIAPIFKKGRKDEPLSSASCFCPQPRLCQQGALWCQGAGEVHTNQVRLGGQKNGNGRRRNDGPQLVCGLPFPVGPRLFVWKLISCPLSTFSWKKDYWVIILFNMFSFLKVLSPSELLSGAVEVKILKAVWRCGRHCTISLSLAFSCFPQVGRQLGILWPRESPSIQTLQLLEFRPVPTLPSIIRSYILPSCSSSSQFQADGSVLCWPAGLELQHCFSSDATLCLTLHSLHDLALLPAVFAFS